MGTNFWDPGKKQQSSFSFFIFAYFNPLPEEMNNFQHFQNASSQQVFITD